MDVIIAFNASAKEIAALVVGLQGRQTVELRDPLEGLSINRPATS